MVVTRAGILFLSNKPMAPPTITAPVLTNVPITLFDFNSFKIRITVICTEKTPCHHVKTPGLRTDNSSGVIIIINLINNAMQK